MATGAGGYSFGNQGISANFGSAGNPGSTAGGFSFGGTGSTGSGSTGGFSFANPAQTTTAFSFGTGAKTSTSTAGTSAFSFANPTTTSASGFSFGAPQTTTTSLTNALNLSTPGLGSSAGFSFCKATTSGSNTTTTAVTTTTSGVLFGSLGGTTTGPSKGLGFALPTTTTTTSSGLSFSGGASTGGLFGTTMPTSNTVLPMPTVSKGLGGVDPKISSGTTGAAGTNGKLMDSKTLMELNMPEQLTATVKSFQNYVSEEKALRDSIAQATSKPMVKIQEDTAALKQLLSVVANGVQRNAVIVEKLKMDTALELKNANMAQRTEEISAVLQDENTAPIKYFQSLVEDFEMQMKAYKEQINNLESHLVSLHQPNCLTPEELMMLFQKCHENFMALAALYHRVHECIKTQKEQYLNYRKIFLGDTKDVFENRRANSKNQLPKPKESELNDSFSGLSNVATIAIAAAISRNQQPTGSPPAGSLGSGSLGSQVGGFGSTVGGGLYGTSTGSTFGSGSTNLFGNTTGTSGFSGFGSQTNPSTTGFSFGGGNTAAVKPLGTGLFGGSTQTGFGSLSGGSTFGLGVTPAASQFNKPFQLQKPPPTTNKRGKR